MKYYSVSYTQIHFTTLLRDLPFTITRYGKPIATVMGKNVAVRLDDKRLKENQVTVKPSESRVFNLCPHGSPLGLCKKGCK